MFLCNGNPRPGRRLFGSKIWQRARRCSPGELFSFRASGKGRGSAWPRPTPLSSGSILMALAGWRGGRAGECARGAWRGHRPGRGEPPLTQRGTRGARQEILSIGYSCRFLALEQDLPLVGQRTRPLPLRWPGTGRLPSSRLPGLAGGLLAIWRRCGGCFAPAP